MKKISPILLFCILLSLFSCNNNRNQSITPKDETQKLSRKEKDIQDSINWENTLKQSLNGAIDSLGKHIYDKNFEKTYQVEAWNVDYGFEMNVGIRMGNLFSNSQKHLLINLTQSDINTYLYLFKVNNDQLLPLLHHKQEAMTFMNDTIFDVNGDGSKDFVVHWYPNSGCCLAESYVVYLNLEKQGVFSSAYDFINPTFSPTEKIIRGMDYGQPGNAELYKYKWNGLNIDTIEYIFPSHIKENHYRKVLKKKDVWNEDKGILLKSIPKEYQNIEGYDWFLNNLNEK